MECLSQKWKDHTALVVGVNVVVILNFLFPSSQVEEKQVSVFISMRIKLILIYILLVPIYREN